MPGTPDLDNPAARALLRGFEKEIFALVADGSDKRFEWLMPVMRVLVLRDKEAKDKIQEADADTGDEDQDTDIQPPSHGVFEDQMFDCAAEGRNLAWRNFLRIPIEAAAFAGRQDLVERLRLAGAPTDRVMVEATRGGHEQFVFDMSLFKLRRYYVCGGTDKDGNTALHIAARDGREQIARTLLLTGAKTKAFNSFGDAPLHVAIKHGQLSVARALLLAGADPGLKQQDEEDVGYWHRSQWEYGLGNSPLLVAVSSPKNRLPMMELLLRHGADPDDGEEYDFTALWSAAHNNDLDAVNLLLEAGASVQDNDEGGSEAPISVAALASNFDMALSLLRHGSKPNVKEQGGGTTLGYAVRCPKMLDLLLRWGADEKVLSEWNGNPGLPAKKERRMQMLLANAPRDRTWRRRGLSVLCRAFPDRCLLEPEHQEEESTQVRAVWVEPVPVPRKRQRLTSGLVFEPRSRDSRGAEDLCNTVDDGEETGARKSSDSPEFSRLTARLLLTLREENVFRHIVEYL